ncbi:MAG TPA: ATP-binding protein, partial [Polyangiales bacterium]
RSTVAEELAAKYPPRRDAASGVPNVLRTGRSELHSEIGDALLVAGCIDAEHLRLMRALGPVSAMVVPLVARGHVLGAMTFVFAESGRHYGQSDLRFAEELALRCTNAIGNARAYSAEQQARRAADLANKAKDEFLAVVSHELRTPLNAIMGWAGMLSTRVLDQAQSARATETIERNAIAMAQLIEDLLDMSRVISGKLRIDVQPVDVARVVDAAIASVTPAASSKDIRLLTTLAPCPPIMGDATRLQQIAWNLLSNAVKFTPKGGRVEIALSHVGTSLELSVADNGQGIAPDFLPNVFEAFRQEDAGPTRHRGGLGLGLAITKQLVELHGGVIAVSSEGPGRGASFSVTLPVSAAGPSGEISERGTRQFPTFSTFDKPEQIRGLRVLVVDDEEDARTLVATILEDCACQVTMAASVREALALFSQHVPDIVVSDIGMPGESGYDLIRQIRALPPERGGNVPAAALTAYARPEDRRKMLNAGFSIHLPKPVEAAELVAVVATLSRFIQRS